jgi:hypothetical protein
MIECGCFGGKHENGDKLLLVKGTFCFVFYSHDDLAPKYAISLTELKAVVQDSGDDRAVVTLESSREVEYEMSFQDLTVAKAFRDAVAKQSALGRAEVAAKVRGVRLFSSVVDERNKRPVFVILNVFFRLAFILDFEASWTSCPAEQESIDQIRGGRR